MLQLLEGTISSQRNLAEKLCERGRHIIGHHYINDSDAYQRFPEKYNNIP